MIEIIKIQGKDTLSINGAIVGTEEDIIMHLKRSANYDELKNLFLNGGDSQ